MIYKPTRVLLLGALFPFLALGITEKQRTQLEKETHALITADPWINTKKIELNLTKLSGSQPTVTKLREEWLNAKIRTQAGVAAQATQRETEAKAEAEKYRQEATETSQIAFGQWEKARAASQEAQQQKKRAARVEEDLKNTREQLNLLQQNIQTLQNDIVAQRVAGDQAQKRIDELTTQLNQTVLQSGILASNLAQRINDIAGLENEIGQRNTTIDQALDQLRALLPPAHPEAQPAADLQKRISEVGNQLKLALDQRASIDEQRNAAQQEIDRLRTENALHWSTIVAQGKTIIDLERKLAQAFAQAHADSKEAQDRLTAENEALRRKLLEQEGAINSRFLESQRTNDELAEQYNNEINRNKKLIGDLQKRLTDMGSIAQENQQLKYALQTLQDQNDIYIKKNVGLKKQLDDETKRYQGDLEIAHKGITDLEKQIGKIDISQAGPAEVITIEGITKVYSSMTEGQKKKLKAIAYNALSNNMLGTADTVATGFIHNPSEGFTKESLSKAGDNFIAAIGAATLLNFPAQELTDAKVNALKDYVRVFKQTINAPPAIVTILSDKTAEVTATESSTEEPTEQQIILGFEGLMTLAKNKNLGLERLIDEIKDARRTSRKLTDTHSAQLAAAYLGAHPGLLKDTKKANDIKKQISAAIAETKETAAAQEPTTSSATSSKISTKRPAGKSAIDHSIAASDFEKIKAVLSDQQKTALRNLVNQPNPLSDASLETFARDQRTNPNAAFNNIAQELTLGDISAMLSWINDELDRQKKEHEPEKDVIDRAGFLYSIFHEQ